MNDVPTPEECQNEDFILELKMELIRRAENRFPNDAIGPVGEKRHLSECFTFDSDGPDFNVLMFHYNVGVDTYVETIVFDHATQAELLKTINGGKKNDRGENKRNS